MPRSLDVILRNEAVDKCKAGDSSVFCGQLIVIPDITQFKLPGVKAQGRGLGSFFFFSFLLINRYQLQTRERRKELAVSSRLECAI